MKIYDVAIWVFFILSLLFNMALIIYILKIIPKKKPMTVDAQAILRDLVNGPVLIKIQYVDPHDFLLRSPRQG